MTTSESLLAAVLSNPADDLPRLVYADYLEENGEPERAEFIRVQVEMAKVQAWQVTHNGGTSTGPDPAKVRRKRVKELHTRERILWFGAHGVGGQIRATLPTNDCGARIDGLAPTDHVHPVAIVRRGFVAEVRCTLSQWCGGECECVSRWELHRVPPGEVIEGHGCYACNGTGTRPGIGPAVVRSHPVEVVRLAGVVSQSGVSGSPFGAVTRESAGPLFAVAFPNAYGGLIEGELGVLNDRISEAALKWAKSQPHPTRITSTPVAVDVTG